MSWKLSWDEAQLKQQDASVMEASAAVRLSTNAYLFIYLVQLPMNNISIKSLNNEILQLPSATEIQ